MSQGKTTIPGVDDKAEMEQTHVSTLGLCFAIIIDAYLDINLFNYFIGILGGFRYLELH